MHRVALLALLTVLTTMGAACSSPPPRHTYHCGPTLMCHSDEACVEDGQPGGAPSMFRCFPNNGCAGGAAIYCGTMHPGTCFEYPQFWIDIDGSLADIDADPFDPDASVPTIDEAGVTGALMPHVICQSLMP